MARCDPKSETGVSRKSSNEDFKINQQKLRNALAFLRLIRREYGEDNIFRSQVPSHIADYNCLKFRNVTYKQIVLISGHGGARGERSMSVGYCLLVFLKLQSRCRGNKKCPIHNCGLFAHQF